MTDCGDQKTNKRHQSDINGLTLLYIVKWKLSFSSFRKLKELSNVDNYILIEVGHLTG